MSPNIFAMLFSANGYIEVGIKVAVGIILTFLIASLVGKTLKSSFSRISKRIKVDETQFHVLRRFAVAIIYALGLTITISFIPGFESVWLSILTGAGVLAVVIGLAAQKTVGNIISGLFIATFQPFRVGDRISIKGQQGIVKDITLMHTMIEISDNTQIVVPNAVISDETIVNYSVGENDVVRSINIGISYNSDIDKTRRVMLDEARKHPDIKKATKSTDFLAKGKEAVVRVTELKDSSVNMQLTFWAKDQPTAIVAGYELLESIKKRFDREGIEIPYPHMSVVYGRGKRKEIEKNKNIEEWFEKEEKTG